MLANNKYNFGRYLVILVITSLLFPATNWAQQELILPHEAYMMGLVKKFDLKVGGSFLSYKGSKWLSASAKRIRQYSGQIAFSPWKRIGIIGSFSGRSGRYVDRPATWSLQHAELAVGTYHEFRKRFPSNFTLRTNLYVGHGRGSSSNILNTAEEIDLKYSRNFIHSGWQLWWKKYISLGYALRFVNLNLKDTTIIGPLSNGKYFFLNRFLCSNPKNFLVSKFHLQGGPEQAKIFLSATRTMATLGGDYHIAYSKMIYKVGLILNIGSFYGQNL